MQAGSIDGTDTAPHDRGIKRALQAYKSGLCKENVIELVRGLWWERGTSHAPVAIYSLVPSGYLWSLLVTFGPFWLPLVPSGYLWLPLVTFGYSVGHLGMHFGANSRGQAGRVESRFMQFEV